MKPSLFLLTVMAIEDGFASSAAVVEPGSAAYFDTQVAPILSRHCVGCHDTVTRKGKLDLSRKSAAFAGGKKGEVIVPGKAEQSRLFKSVLAGDMPEDRPPLSATEQEILRKWINAGAAWPGEELDPVAHLRKSGAAQNWVRVVAQLQAMGAFDNTFIFFASDNGASAEIMVRHGGHDPQAAPGSAACYLCLGPGFSSACNTPFRRQPPLRKTRPSPATACGGCQKSTCRPRRTAPVAS